MASSRFRVGGAYTRIAWSPGAGANSTVNPGTAKTLSYVDVISETAPRYVAQPQAIQPLDAQYPIEIAFPGALEAGSIEIQFREQFQAEVWEQFYQYYINNGVTTRISDLLGIFKAQLQSPNSGLTLQKVIIDPTTNQPIRWINYLNPTIVNIMIDERVNIGSMTFPKSVQFMYTQRQEVYAADIGQDSGSQLPGGILPSAQQTLIASYDSSGNPSITA